MTHVRLPLRFRTVVGRTVAGRAVAVLGVAGLVSSCVGVASPAPARTPSLPVVSTTKLGSATGFSVGSVTSGGLLVAGGTLWAWAGGILSWGYQYVQVSRIVLASAAVHTVTSSAVRGDWAADASGLYLEEHAGSGTDLVHVTPAGAVRRRAVTAPDVSLVLYDRQLAALLFKPADDQLVRQPDLCQDDGEPAQRLDRTGHRHRRGPERSPPPGRAGSGGHHGQRRPAVPGAGRRLARTVLLIVPPRGLCDLCRARPWGGLRHERELIPEVRQGRIGSMTQVSCARRVRAMAVLGVAGLIGSGVAAVGPAAAALAAPATPALRVTSTTKLGSAAGIYSDSFTQTPGGTVYYSRGDKVFRAGRSQAVRTAAQPVLALAANSADYFVQTGLRVGEYRQSTGRLVRQWKLTSPVSPITSAGLLVVGSTLWSWTDWATDGSGFQYAKVSRISTSSATVHKVSTQGFPGDWVAGSAGLYLEEQIGLNTDLAHVTPAGAVNRRVTSASDAPLVLSGGRLDALDFTAQGPAIQTFSVTTLKRVLSRAVFHNDRAIAGTTAGLLTMVEPCSSLSCAGTTVDRLSAASGRDSGGVTVADADVLMAGPHPAVITDRGGQLYLVRIGA